MTEIKIEKKKAVWPWILIGLILLAVILYFVFFNNRNDNTAVKNTDTTTTVVANTTTDSVVTDYVNYIKADTSKMALDHTYSSTALLKLIQAVQSKANDINYDIKADTAQEKSYAKEITDNPYVTTHADTIRKVADMLSTTLGNIQRDKYPSLNMEANDVKTAAAAIKPGTLTLDQKNAVQTFFDKAGNLLQKMN